VQPPGKRQALARFAARIALLIGLASLTTVSATAQAGSDALLEVTPPDRPEADRFHHDILISFRDAAGRTVEVPRTQITDPSRYDLRSECIPDDPVMIERVIWRGVGHQPEHGIGAVLYADLDPRCAYTLRIDLPNVSRAPIRVKLADDLAPEPEQGFQRVLRFIDRHISGTADLRTLEREEDKVGIDFQVQLDFPVVRRRAFADRIRCRLRADGMLAVRKSARKAHNALDLELGFSWLRTYTLPGPARGSRYAHAIGFQLSPAGLESDQNFHRVDYALGPSVTFSIPFLDWPLLLWHRAIEMPRGFLPPTARVAFTYLHRVRDGEQPRPDRRRIDLEIVAVAPILRPLDVLLRHKIFYDLESRQRESNVELTWRWYVGRRSRTAILLKLVHGALPPLYSDVEIASIGFQVGI